MRLMGETFPLLLHVGPMEYTEETVREMDRLYRAYFERGERYALLALQPKAARTPGPKERKLITDWTTSPRVFEASKKLCVASATVLPNAVARGVYTALMWIWSPPFPVKAASTVDEGLDHCLAAIERAGLKLPRPAHSIRQEVLTFVKELV